MSTDEDRIKEAIGYEPIVISIDGHPNIGQTYRTVNDRDDLVRRLLPVLAAVRAETQATILQAIDDVHQPVDAMNFGPRTPQQTRVCAGCGQDDGNWSPWPCRTVRAVVAAVAR